MDEFDVGEEVEPAEGAFLSTSSAQDSLKRDVQVTSSQDTVSEFDSYESFSQRQKASQIEEPTDVEDDTDIEDEEGSSQVEWTLKKGRTLSSQVV